MAWGQQVQELPTLGGANARAYDVNDVGQIVGVSTHAGEAVAEATVWNAQIPTGLGMAAGTNFSFANAINNIGEVAGYSEVGTVPEQPGNAKTATFWGAGGAFDIGGSMSLDHSTAYDLNDGGVVALQGDHPGEFGLTTGFVWSLSMGGTQAGPDPFYRFGANFGINILNDLVGNAAASFDGAQAIYARFNGAGWDTGIEIGPQAVRDPAVANAISDTGIIVGQAGDGRRHRSEAAIFTIGARKPVAWLDKLDDFDDSNALDVNDAGLIVGESRRFASAGVDQRAVVWVDENILDLNYLLNSNSEFHQLLSATGVNNNGAIVGYGRLFNGDVRAFVIDPFVRNANAQGLYGQPAPPRTN
jgi:uncharacterized membrane protein